MNLSYWFDWIFRGGNYGLVARSITAYHERILIDYRDIVSTYENLLLLAVVFDAQVYIARKEISLEQIHSLVREVVEAHFDDANSWPTDRNKVTEVLTDIICRVEFLELSVDNSSISKTAIGDNINNNRHKIIQNIKYTFKKYDKGKGNAIIDTYTHIKMLSFVARQTD